MSPMPISPTTKFSIPAGWQAAAWKKRKMPLCLLLEWSRSRGQRLTSWTPGSSFDTRLAPAAEVQAKPSFADDSGGFCLGENGGKKKVEGWQR